MPKYKLLQRITASSEERGVVVWTAVSMVVGMGNSGEEGRVHRAEREGAGLWENRLLSNTTCKLMLRFMSQVGLLVSHISDAIGMLNVRLSSLDMSVYV